MKQNRKGQGLVEYLVLVGLISLASIAIVRIVGKNISELYAKVSNRLRGSEEQIQMTRPEESTYQARNLQNLDE